MTSKQKTADTPREKISLREQADCARRELTMRYKVYGYRVKDGKMTEAEKAHEIDTMRAIRDTLDLFSEFETEIRATLAACLAKRNAALKQQSEETPLPLDRMTDVASAAEKLGDHPAVAAVNHAFPGATVVDVRPINQQ